MRAAEGFAERGGVGVDFSEDAELLTGPPPRFSDDARRMRVVDHEKRAVLFRELDFLLERSERALHREDAVGHDDFVARVFRRFERAAQIVHVAILEALFLRL